ncbi:hypothetical protein M408DRAFT_333347 [Serendipita vermifera MAFF 305830]|uniref:LITAF domain-containing protein n=1 Tax=Serendipita vermifera MAFF 305830 TaxID=933852 RepID=A0A0C2WWB5_SERVB|nr:hypothetical protein M408DRAFT_333347 [Serendipita vermifera MAFF 305830]
MNNNSNAGQVPAFHTTASFAANSPPYSPQQTVYAPEKQYDQQALQQQQQQQGFVGQQPGAPFATGQQPGVPFATGQQPQAYPMNPNPAMNPGAHPHVVVVQQSPIPMQYIPQPMYGQQFPSSIPPGGFSSAPGLIVCPRCGVRGLTRTTPVSGSTTHLWAAFLCFFFCLGCIPYLLNDLKDVEHHCCSCGAHVGTWRR